MIDATDAVYPGEPVITANADGSDAEPSIDPNAVVYAYAATPTEVAYFSGTNLYVSHDGGASTLLATGVEEAGGISLSPNGKAVAWFDRNSSTRDVMMIATDGSDQTPHRLTSGLSVTAPWDTPSWSPDGTKIVFSSLGSIDTVDLDGNVSTIIPASPGMFAQSPAWGPSGTISFWNRDGGPNEDVYELRLVGSDGGNPRVLATWPAANDSAFIRSFAQPIWSPDESRLAFAPTNFFGGEADLFVVDTTTGAVTNLLADTNGDNVAGCQDQPNAIAFSPDGTSITYSNRDASGFCGVFVAQLATSEPTLALMSDASADSSGDLERVVASLAGLSAGTPVTFTITGPNAQTATIPTDANGDAIFFYFAGADEGTDAVSATAAVSGQLLTSNTVVISHTLPPAPPATRSHYEAYIGQKYFVADGTQAGASGKSGPVILLMGTSTDTGQILYGLSTRGGGERSLTAILRSLERFSNAYHNAWQGPGRGDIQIVWGTNSAFPAPWNSDLPRASAAGARFAKAVLQYANWVANPSNHDGQTYNRQAVMAGIDIEENPDEGWSAYPVVQAFLQGFTSVVGHPALVNFGALTFDPLCDSDACSYQGRGWTGGHVADTTRYPLGEFACPQAYSSDQIGYWLGLEQATGADTSVHKWGGDPIYFSCILTGDGFEDRQTAWNTFVGGLAQQRRTLFLEKKVSQIDTRAAAERRFFTNGTSIPLP